MVPPTLEVKLHKLETVRISILLNVFVDVPILHPFRYHREDGKGFIHRYPQ